MSTGSMLALLAAAVLVFWMLGAYNRLMALRNAIGQAWTQADAALSQRGDVVLQLAAALGSEPGPEREADARPAPEDPPANERAAVDALLHCQAQVVQAADALRPKPVQAGPAHALADADALMVPAVAQMLAALDEPPADADMTEVKPLQAALRDAEARWQFSRQLFNDAVLAYNDAARQWPTQLVARLYGFGTAGRL